MEEMNEQTQNKPINETAMDAVKERYMPKKKSGLNPHNKAVASLLAVLVLAIGLAVGVSIVQKQSTEERAGADTAPDVGVLLNSATTELAAGGEAVIDVSIDPSSNKKRITAADFKFKLVDASGALSNAATITNIVINANGKLKEELLKTGLNTSEARLAVGAQCTETGGTASCALLEGDAALLTATVTVRANQNIQAGTLKLSVTGTEVAALDAENNNAAINANVASGTLPEKVFTLTSDGGPTADKCRADIVDRNAPSDAAKKDLYVNGADFAFMSDAYDLANTCSGADCRADIVDRNAPTDASKKDLYVNGADFAFMSDAYDLVSKCNE